MDDLPQRLREQQPTADNEATEYNPLWDEAAARIEELEALVHRAHNLFENITVAASLEEAQARAHRGVAFTEE